MEQNLFSAFSMAVILGISILVFILPHPLLLKNLAELFEPLHLYCLSATPTGSYRHFYDAIVCGKSLKPENAEVFRVTGVIHLLVVSGSHLIVLTQILEKLLPSWPRLHFLILALFAGFTGFQPPVARALVSFVLGRV